MACRSIGTGTESEGLAGSRIMACVVWPWSARKPSIDRRPKPRTIGRIIADCPDKMRRPVNLGPKGQRIERKRNLKGRKPKGYKASAPGECGAFDTVEYFLDGIRRYVITFTDRYSRCAFAWATQSHASLAARELFGVVTEVFPYPLQSVLTDNGSEFMKHFDEELRRLHRNHWQPIPRLPR